MKKEILHIAIVNNVIMLLSSEQTERLLGNRCMDALQGLCVETTRTKARGGYNGTIVYGINPEAFRMICNAIGHILSGSDLNWEAGDGAWIGEEKGLSFYVWESH